MKKILVPLVLLLLGVGGGVGAGLFLVKPAEEPMEVTAELTCEDMEPVDPVEMPPEPGELEAREYARMSNQFVVPIVSEERVDALVVMSLSIEVETGGKEAVFAHEPKLRDSFLQVMFDHANMGGFSGAFTSTSNMRLLREALREAAFDTMNGHITDVLIIDIVRQDVTN